MKKLSKAQQKIIDLLNSGWEIGWGLDMSGRVWIQKGGAGRGGESKRVSLSTAKSLREAGKIVCVESRFPMACYRVSPNVKLTGRPISAGQTEKKSHEYRKPE